MFAKNGHLKKVLIQYNNMRVLQCSESTTKLINEIIQDSINDNEQILEEYSPEFDSSIIFNVDGMKSYIIRSSKFMDLPIVYDDDDVFDSSINVAKCTPQVQIQHDASSTSSFQHDVDINSINLSKCTLSQQGYNATIEQNNNINTTVNMASIPQQQYNKCNIKGSTQKPLTINVSSNKMIGQDMEVSKLTSMINGSLVHRDIFSNNRHSNQNIIINVCDASTLPLLPPTSSSSSSNNVPPTSNIMEPETYNLTSQQLASDEEISNCSDQTSKQRRCYKCYKLAIKNNDLQTALASKTTALCKQLKKKIILKNKFGKLRFKRVNPKPYSNKIIEYFKLEIENLFGHYNDNFKCNCNNITLNNNSK